MKITHKKLRLLSLSFSNAYRRNPEGLINFKILAVPASVHRGPARDDPVPFHQVAEFIRARQKESAVSSATTSSCCEKGRKSSSSLFPFGLREYFSPSFYLLPDFSPPAVFQRQRKSPVRGTFGYFTFNFVSSAHCGSWENYVSRPRNSGEERRRAGRAREPRVEIIVATLIIYSLPTLTPSVP